MNVTEVIAHIAEIHGVTPQKVEAQMQDAIREAMQSGDCTAQELWREIAQGKESVSIERFLSYCACLLDGHTGD